MGRAYSGRPDGRRSELEPPACPSRDSRGRTGEQEWEALLEPACWPFRALRAHCDEQRAGLGGRATSSGTEPLATTAESVDDAVRRLVVERSHDLVTLCDLTGAIVYASPSWANLGWEPRDLAGVAVLELIHPDDAALATEAWNEVAAGTDVDAVTIRLRRAGGSYAWFEVNGSAVRDDDGELRFMLGTARDVSEREELRWRLRDLDAVYRFADAVAGARALDEVLEAALDALLEATGADRASVLLADDDGVLRFRAWRGLSDRYRAYTEGRSPWPPDGRDPQPVLVEDVAAAATSRRSSASCARRESQRSRSSRWCAAGSCSGGSRSTATRRTAGATARCSSRGRSRTTSHPSSSERRPSTRPRARARGSRSCSRRPSS